MMFGRRDFLRTAALASLSYAGAGPSFAKSTTTDSKLIPYGAAVYLPDMQTDSRVGESVLQYCSRITPVNEMKWDAMRPSPDTYDFTSVDAIANFARQNKLTMHGHPLVWYAALPSWISSVSGAATVEKLMEDHINTTVARYKDVTRSWDVVNEPIPDAADGPKARRDGFWYENLGNEHIDKAFRYAHAADPTAQLVLNEYDIEFSIRHSPNKRAAFRDLVLELLDRDVPIHAIGLQGHLRGGWPIAKDELAAFVSEMRGYGLAILVTELDVMDHELPEPADERDAIISAQVKDFLEAASEGGPLDSITTWGISDQYSWIRWAYPRKDGTVNRPLPLDWSFQPKSMLSVINEFRNRGA
ncbi:endo-1,4-beta-xylanase [Agrobacterium sp.]|uniref:endo-1,4-beta-xylanase n=1 Tax=Agrobacterium sp. TaxID=361 RepID=UPI00391C0903